MSETVGQTIRQARHDCGLTLAQLAEIVHCGVPYLSKIERGMWETASEELLSQIAWALGLPSDRLIMAAGRIPKRYIEALTADPVRGLAHLRRFHG